MRRLILANLRAHLLRLALSVLAVVGGIGLMAGAFSLSDTISARFDKLFNQIGVGKDVIVSGKAAFGDSQSRQRIEVPQDLVATIRAVPGVAGVEGTITNLDTIVLDKQGKAPSSFGPPGVGSNYQLDRSMSASKLIAGSPPQGDTQITLDNVTLKKLGYQLGDQVMVNTPHGAMPFTVVGVTKFGGDGSNGASVVNFETSVAQKIYDHVALFDEIDVRAEPGVTQESLARRVQAAVGARYQAITGKQSAADAASELKDNIKFVLIAVQGFALITLFVGAFIIVNTFSILVAQRTRELGLLRALGASRSQVRSAVLVEAAAVGLVGSILGILFGLALAGTLNAVLALISGQSPSRPTISIASVIICLVVGVVITIASGVFPSIKASSVSPLEAMRDANPGEGTISPVRAVASVLVLLVGSTLLEAGLRSSAIFLLPAIPTIFIGAAMVLATIARPLAAALGSPLATLGQPAKIGKANAMRNPRRTAITASALMIGLALVGAAFTFASSLVASSTAIIDRELRGDLIVQGGGRGFGGLGPDVQQRIATLPSVRKSTGVRFAAWRVGTSTSSSAVAGVGADAIDLLGLDITKGSGAGLANGGLLVSEDTFKKDKLSIGEQLDVVWARTGPSKATVVGAYRTSQIAGDYLISLDEMAENTTGDEDAFVIVAAKDGQAAQALTEVQAAIKSFPRAEVETRAQFVQANKDQVQIFLNIILALLVLCIIIAIVGIVNTLALSVYERTREIGLLRAVGMQRTQVKRMVRVEAVIVAVLGAVVGLSLGVLLGAAGVQALKGEGITEFVIPYGRLVVALVFAGFAGVIAAIFPARRAVKLDILTAIATD